MDFVYALILAAGPGTVLPFVRAQLSDGGPAANETELIHNALAGQRAAQHTLYVRHYERVHARISRLLGRWSEVDDALQDTFVAAFRDLGQLTDATRFGSWVCGIAVHQVQRRLRRRKLMQRLGFDHEATESTLAQTADPAASPETRLLLKQLDAALSTLAPRHRVAWMLRHVEGCSLDEVAEHCSISLATAKRDIAHAETHLHAHFEQGRAQ